MSFSWTRVRAILVKELKNYRRNRFVLVFAMTIPPADLHRGADGPVAHRAGSRRQRKADRTDRDFADLHADHPRARPRPSPRTRSSASASRPRSSQS